MREISKNEKVAPVAGLSQPELIVLASAAGNVMLPGEGITAYIVKNDVERSGFTTLGFALGIKRLTARGFVTLRESSNYNGEPYQEIVLADVAWDWIEQNESKFVIRKQDDPTSEPDPF